MMTIYQDILYYLNLTGNSEILWTVLPLAIATLVMLFYFEKYRDEKGGWNTYTSNSLVLLFVAVALIRYIYGIEELGAVNFVSYPYKFGVTILMLLIGVVLMLINFAHFLPEKIALHITSPLTLNLIAYIMILYVYSELENSLESILSLIILFAMLVIVLNLIKIPIKKLFVHLKKMKDKEKVEEIVAKKKPLEEKKEILKKEAKKITVEKSKVKKQEKKIKSRQLKKLDKLKKETVRLKKIVRGEKVKLRRRNRR